MTKLVSMLTIIGGLCMTLAAQPEQPRYVTGMVVFGGSSPSCPFFIGRVQQDSPAAHAGIQVGDRLVAVDGHPITDIRDLAQRIASNQPTPVTVQLIRGEKSLTVTVRRKDRTAVLRADGWRMFKGEMVPLNATDAEADYMIETWKKLKQEEVSVAFPGHYPADEKLYYPGFEAFVWKHQKQVTVGGMEEGPARRAGMRWGDRIVAINGADADGKSASELESLLASRKPDRMDLTIERAGARKTISFTLEKASKVLRENHWQIEDGRLVPLWLPKQYLHCFQ
jgi:predicted metalloprotease with PDZ domain